MQKEQLFCFVFCLSVKVVVTNECSFLIYYHSHILFLVKKKNHVISILWIIVLPPSSEPKFLRCDCFLKVDLCLVAQTESVSCCLTWIFWNHSHSH